MPSSLFNLAKFLLLIQCIRIAHADFRCKNGQIISASQKCDAHVDCNDGSDETFEECYWQSCPELRCSYGGCFSKNQQCDNITNCHDGTDEHWTVCFYEKAFKERSIQLRGNCSENQFKCTNTKECILYKHVCDGFKDCKDGSDETAEQCAPLSCLSDSFRCAYGGCIPKVLACDLNPDCADESDEVPSICQRIRANTSMTALPPITTSPSIIEEPSSKTNCLIPFSNNAQVNTLFGALHSTDNSSILDRTVVRLSCESPYVLNGSEINSCQNGKWQADWPECLITCNGTSFEHTSTELKCIVNNVVKDCNSPATKFFVNSKIEVTCAAGFVAKDTTNSKSERICSDTGKWMHKSNVSILKCLPDCGRVLPTVQEDPWVVSIFEQSESPNYNFTCLGVIVSANRVLAVKTCFRNSDPFGYVIVEGNRTTAFNPREWHAYKTHHVKKIRELKRKSDTNGSPFVLVELSEPLVVSAQVLPACIKPPINQNGLKTNREYSLPGQPYIEWYPKEEKFYVKSMWKDEKTKIDINNYKGLLATVLH